MDAQFVVQIILSLVTSAVSVIVTLKVALAKQEERLKATEREIVDMKAALRDLAPRSEISAIHAALPSFISRTEFDARWAHIQSDLVTIKKGLEQIHELLIKR